jgi:hypothetical protein
MLTTRPPKPLRGTNWVFKYSSLRFVCKGLNAVATQDTQREMYSMINHGRKHQILRIAWLNTANEYRHNKISTKFSKRSDLLQNKRRATIRECSVRLDKGRKSESS